MSKKNVISVVLFVIGIIAIYAVLSLFARDDANSLARVSLHDYYETDEINTLILGPSHVYAGIDSGKLSEVLGESVFSAATPMQESESSYYLLKETIDRGVGLKRVVLEISPAVISGRNKSDNIAISVISNMKNSKNKFAYVQERFEYGDWANVFSSVRRGIDPMSLPTVSTLLSTFGHKMTADYWNYQPGPGIEEEYVGRGTWIRHNTLNKYGVAIHADSKKLDKASAEDIDPIELEYYGKCIDLCKENGIDVSVYISAFSAPYIYMNGGLWGFAEAIGDFVKEHDARFIDMNSVKHEYLPLDDSYFDDQDHLNVRGNELLTYFLAEYLTTPDVEYCNDSYAERIPDDATIALMYNMNYRAADGTEGDWNVMEDCGYPIKEFVVDFFPIPESDDSFSYKVYHYDVDGVDLSDRVVLNEEQLGSGVVGEEVVPETGDDGVQYFWIPYDELYKYFKVDVIDSNSGDIVYSVCADFER